MNICLISAEFPPICGGVGVFALNLATGLKESGVQVSVVTSTPRSVRNGAQRAAAEALDITYGRTALNRRYVKLLPLLLSSLRVCLQRRPDRLIAMVWTHDGLVAHWLNMCVGLPYAVVVHGSELVQNKQPGLRRSLMLRVLRSASWVVANSDFSRRQVIEFGIDPQRIHVIHPPVWVAEASENKRLGDELDLGTGPVLLTAARMYKRKGHAEVIRALGEIRERFPDVIYVITGEGEYRRVLERLADQLGVSDRVRFVGFVSEERLSELYQRCTLYISPSQDDEGDVEGFGIALVEAGAHGKPVIAGRSGGVEDAIEDGVTGVLVDSSSLEQVRDALVRLLEDPALRERFGQAGRVRATTCFPPRVQAERLRKLLSDEVPRFRGRGRDAAAPPGNLDPVE